MSSTIKHEELMMNRTPKASICAGITVVIVFLCCIRTVPPAHIGVVTTFGSVHDNTLDSGPHMVNPLSSIKLFVTKTQLLEQDNHVPTKEGLTVELDVALLYHIQPDQARQIYTSLGLEYISTIIKPELASAVRGLTSEVEAKALYTSGRMELQKKLIIELETALKPRGIIVETVLLKAVKLPTMLTHSIELKAQAEQEAARMEFVLTKETQEANRKSIEAKGIASFQTIVSQGISDNLLKWKGIEATEKLAESTNSKIVIMGNSRDSLPVILGGADTPTQVKAKAV